MKIKAMRTNREKIRVAMLRARMALGMGQPEFGQALGISWPMVGSYERGINPWPPYALARIFRLWQRVNEVRNAWDSLGPILREAQEIEVAAEFPKVS